MSEWMNERMNQWAVHVKMQVCIYVCMHAKWMKLRLSSKTTLYLYIYIIGSRLYLSVCVNKGVYIYIMRTYLHTWASRFGSFWCPCCFWCDMRTSVRLYTLADVHICTDARIRKYVGTSIMSAAAPHNPSHLAAGPNAARSGWLSKLV